MIKWYLPMWSNVAPDKRINMLHFVSRIEDDVRVVYPDGRDWNYPAVYYMIRIYEWEQSERRNLQVKFDELQTKFIEKSKELSLLKKNKIAS